MPTHLLALSIAEGALVLGPPDRLGGLAGVRDGSSAVYISRMREILARSADPWRLRTAAVGWGLESFGRLTRPERDLRDAVAGLVESGRLALGFLPAFKSDERAETEGEWGEDRLQVYRLAAGPKTRAPPGHSRADPSRPPPPPTVSRSQSEPEKDFANEPAQVGALVAAADSGAPFCEICERMKGGK